MQICQTALGVEDICMIHVSARREQRPDCVQSVLIIEHSERDLHGLQMWAEQEESEFAQRVMIGCIPPT